MGFQWNANGIPVESGILLEYHQDWNLLYLFKWNSTGTAVKNTSTSGIPLELQQNIPVLVEFHWNCSKNSSASGIYVKIISKSNENGITEPSSSGIKKSSNIQKFQW